MELSYIQSCPSCGAPVEVAEAERLVACKYCDNSNYLISRGPLRFVLPNIIPDSIDENQIFHIPYLRFKGHIYSCLGASLEHKIVDTTQLGCAGNVLPASLGLRPQAMRIRLLGPDHRGRFVRLTEQVRDIFAKAAKLTQAFAETQNRLYHRSFIGETISYIYLPTYFYEGRLMDGVLNREIGAGSEEEMLLKNSVPYTKQWLPQYIATLCPHCGASMSAAGDSLVLECRNCESLWQEKKGRFARVPFAVAEPLRGDRYLPFWKIKVDGTTTLQLESYADFLRLTNQPVVIREEHQRLQLFFWIPAFKIRPKHFLAVAKNATLSQTRIPPTKGELKKNLYPVTLPADEAFQAIKAVLAETVLNKRTFMPELPRVKLNILQQELVYLPFSALGHDLIQDHTSITLSRKILYYGGTM